MYLGGDELQATELAFLLPFDEGMHFRVGLGKPAIQHPLHGSSSGRLAGLWTG